MADTNKNKQGGLGKGPMPKPKNVPINRSLRAGLNFPVGRIHRHLKQPIYNSNRVGASGAIYTGAVLEYLTAELLELAGNACRDAKMKRIAPRHLLLAIRGDEELDRLIRGIIPGGGVVPHIHKSLMQTRSETKARAEAAAKAAELANTKAKESCKE